MRRLFSMVAVVGLVTASLPACGEVGSCLIECVQPTSVGSVTHEFGPYEDETEESCHEEAARATEELAHWDSVCSARFSAY